MLPLPSELSLCSPLRVSDMDTPTSLNLVNPPRAFCSGGSIRTNLPRPYIFADSALLSSRISLFPCMFFSLRTFATAGKEVADDHRENRDFYLPPGTRWLSSVPRNLITNGMTLSGCHSPHSASVFLHSWLFFANALAVSDMLQEILLGSGMRLFFQRFSWDYVNGIVPGWLRSCGFLKSRCLRSNDLLSEVLFSCSIEIDYLCDIS